MKRIVITTLLASILLIGITPIAASAEWKQNINKQWCFFDSRNSKVMGWQSIDGAWYYFDPNGIMKTAWVEDGGQWYYFNELGVMQIGWIKQGGSWYHLGNTGVMDKDTVVGGYYLGEDGIMQDINKNKVLFEDNYIKVTYIGINKESKLGPKIKVQIENKSDKDLCIQTKDDVTVDNTKKNASFNEEIAPKNTVIANFILSDSTDKNFKSVNGRIKIIEKASWSTLEIEEFSMSF
ncbi:MAG: cell wall-binding protein [Clostridium sp.]|uniref:cell wall-binding protein n=1 Tax=Clostridium sp. TaxID=1506 RepID=UPI0025BC121A|nr:cell wall-binding protein [Clostridium sp.]MCE5221766.1 cell wall-binding protein [Clostridium sp.]